ncbi:MAG: ABC transporter substrate-binding protein [Pseudomonadota bacterium]
MGRVIRALFVVCVGLLVPAAAAQTAAAETSLKLTVLKFGTVNWELDTIKHYGLDTAEGLSIAVEGVAGSAAAQVAFLGGETDVIVSDWLWVARQRAAGKDFVFIPYSKAVGGVMVPATSTAKTLADLDGGKIGIAGGPVDKSWLILKAYAQKAYGMDLGAATEQVFGAPPLIFKTALSGDLDGAINYWHFMAKMGAGGMRPLITTAEAATALGLDPDTPLLGYVVRGETVRQNPQLVAGLRAASRAAKARLATDDGAWERLRGRMKVSNDAEFEALKAGFRAGIPADAPVDEAAADKMLQLMIDLAGDTLVGAATTLPDGVFYQPQS